MIEYGGNGSTRRIFICDACGRKITDPADVRLLREAGALPEERPCHTHAGCYEAFVARHGGGWQLFLLSSKTAAWFI